MNKKHTIKELAYTGGIIDGEGYIGIRRVKTKNSQRGFLLCLKVHVTNTNSMLVKWLQSLYGGSVYCHPHIGNRKDDWQWCVQTAQALKFLKLIIPYLKIKKRQATIAIPFGLRRKQGKKKAWELKEDDRDALAIKKLNARGYG